MGVYATCVQSPTRMTNTPPSLTNMVSMLLFCVNYLPLSVNSFCVCIGQMFNRLIILTTIGVLCSCVEQQGQIKSVVFL